MRPSREQIELAAYERWQRRGSHHGDDRHDWLAAENDLVFALNYRVVRRVRLAQPTPFTSARKRCRFCERTEPSVTFGGCVSLVPDLAGPHSVLAEHECDDCRADFRASLEGHFARFLAPFRAIPTVRGLLAQPSYTWDSRQNTITPSRRLRADGLMELRLGSEPYLPIAAFKFLTRLALGLMPEEDLAEFAGAVEWIANPDHQQDLSTLGSLTCHVYLAPTPFAAPWASLARMIDPEARYPSLLFLAGSDHVALQIAVPFGQRDEDHDGGWLPAPTVTLPGGAEVPPSEAPCLAIPMGSAIECRNAVLDLLYRADALHGFDLDPELGMPARSDDALRRLSA